MLTALDTAPQPASVSSQAERLQIRLQLMLEQASVS